MISPKRISKLTIEELISDVVYHHLYEPNTPETHQKIRQECIAYLDSVLKQIEIDKQNFII